MLSTRREALKLIQKLEFHSGKVLLKIVICLIIAILVGLFPEYEGLTRAGHWGMFILVFSALLWVTEAIPAFSVAILVIALSIGILGTPGNVMHLGPKGWTIFVNSWSSPLIWLFFGGFVLASAAHKTKLDQWIAQFVLRRCGSKPPFVLLGLMSITFIFSMFMSNTATTAMMMAVISPIVLGLKEDNKFAKAVLLGIPFAANVGGMGTIIGTPPNAIAAGTLGSDVVNFYSWMRMAVPPSILMIIFIWILLLKRYPSNIERIDVSNLDDSSETNEILPNWKKIMVMVTFFITIGLWMTGSLHKIPTAVISFIPITVLTTLRVLTTRDMKNLSWDVLLLLAGGLTLGIVVSKTGLASWIVTSLPLSDFGIMGMAIGFTCISALLSNFMSNTAAANVMVPIGMAFGVSIGNPLLIVLPLTLGSSLAMCLPISTPPNAIAFTSGKLKTTDFLGNGGIIGAVGVVIIIAWLFIVLN